MKLNKTENMAGISRIDAERARGWYVRIYYEENHTHAKFFSDSVHGGKNKALEAAQHYREQYIRTNPPPPKLPFQRKPIATNTTGINGISETFERARNGEKIPCFSVYWAPQPNQPRTKRFYHHHYGSREEALEEAIKFRREKEDERLRKWAEQQGKPVEVYKAVLNR